MGEEANAVLQHAQHLGPLDHSMQREALICKEDNCSSLVCQWYISTLLIIVTVTAVVVPKVIVVHQRL